MLRLKKQSSQLTFAAFLPDTPATPLHDFVTGRGGAKRMRPRARNGGTRKSHAFPGVPAKRPKPVPFRPRSGKLIPHFGAVRSLGTDADPRHRRVRLRRRRPRGAPPARRTPGPRLRPLARAGRARRRAPRRARARRRRDGRRPRGGARGRRGRLLPRPLDGGRRGRRVRRPGAPLRRDLRAGGRRRRRAPGRLPRRAGAARRAALAPPRLPSGRRARAARGGAADRSPCAPRS